MDPTFKGILIDQSVSMPENILKNVELISTREATLEGESFRGNVLFHCIEVASDNLWLVLHGVAETIKEPGWYFHLVNEETLYIVLPKAIFSATNTAEDLKRISDYALSLGIHPDQLNLKQLFDNPFA